MKYISKVDSEFIKNFVEEHIDLKFKEIKVQRNADGVVVRCVTSSDLVIKLNLNDFGVKETWCSEWFNGYWQGEMFKKFGVKYYMDLKKHILKTEKEKEQKLNK